METTKTQLMSTKEIVEMSNTLPQHSSSWLKGNLKLFKYQGVWYVQKFLIGRILAQQSFKARPSDVFLCSYPKSGTTWLKALTYAIITREMFDESNVPLLTTTPHKCILTLEKDYEQILENHPNTPIATHLPYNCLPESILTSKCKMVYIYRNTKDVMVSYYHFARQVAKVPMEDSPFEEAFNEFCQGVSSTGPYWDHVSGYSKAILERPESMLLLKYEDMKKDPTSNVKRLAEFIGYPFTAQEEEEGVIESIVKMCSFENLSNLQVNKSVPKVGEQSFAVENQKSGPKVGEQPYAAENHLYFRKAKDGDWQNYFTDEMIEKVDKLIDEKMGATGLVLK